MGVQNTSPRLVRTPPPGRGTVQTTSLVQKGGGMGTLPPNPLHPPYIEPWVRMVSLDRSSSQNRGEILFCDVSCFFLLLSSLIENFYSVRPRHLILENPKKPLRLITNPNRTWVVLLWCSVILWSWVFYYLDRPPKNPHF